METTSWIMGMLFGTAFLALGGSQPASDLYDVDVRELASLWEKERISPTDPYALKHAELKQRLQGLVTQYPEALRIRMAGRSAEGREIFLVSAGTGSRKILLWSQMHGDEPTATCSLLDIFRFFGLHGQEGWVAQLLRDYTLLFVPMLNPDGAERGQRRNAQNIDINRDARMLQTPEGRLLKDLKGAFSFLFKELKIHSAIAEITSQAEGEEILKALEDFPSLIPPRKTGLPRPQRES